MKIILLLLLAICSPFILFGQATVLAHKNATRSLIKNMNDPSSYKPVSWGKLEKVYINFDQTETGKILNEQISGLSTSTASLTEANRRYIVNNSGGKNDEVIQISNDQIKSNMHSIDSLNNLIKLGMSKFKPTFSHYYLEHTFRAKNAYNATILKTYTFILNKSLSVIDFGDKSESERERQDLLNRISDLSSKTY